MPRNGTGTYTLPQPPFQPQTTISSAAVNADLADIANAITASVPRDGQAGMTAVLPLAAAGFNYSNDDDTGLYRSNANEQTIQCGGQPVVVIKQDGMYTPGGAEIASFVLGVPYPWLFSTAPTGTVFAYGQPCTPTYPKLRALLINDGAPFGNNGTDPLFPDLRGAVIAGRSNMGGAERGNLTGGNAIGAQLGTQTVTLDVTQIPAHSHTGSGSTASAGDHAHTGGGTTGLNSNDHTHTGGGTTGAMNANASHSHSITGGVWGGQTTKALSQNDTPSPSDPATIAIAATNTDHGHVYSFVTSGVSANHTHAYSFTTSTNGAHVHTFSFTTNNAGGGAAHPNVQPTLVLNYIMRAA